MSNAIRIMGHPMSGQPLRTVHERFAVTDPEARAYYRAQHRDAVGEAVHIDAERGPGPWFYGPAAVTRYTWYVAEVLDDGAALILARIA